MMPLLKTLPTAILALIAVFAPAESIILATLVLVLADLITGVLASRKQGLPITSNGMKTTVIKLLMYEITVCLAYLVGAYLTGPLVPVLHLVSSVIGITELKSVLENLDIISGGSFLKAVTAAINSYISRNPPE